MKWPSERARLCFVQLFPQYANASVHYALDVLVDEVTTLRQQLAARHAPPATADTVPDWFTRGT